MCGRVQKWRKYDYVIKIWPPTSWGQCGMLFLATPNTKCKVNFLAYILSITMCTVYRVLKCIILCKVLSLFWF